MITGKERGTSKGKGWRKGKGKGKGQEGNSLSSQHASTVPAKVSVPLRVTKGSTTEKRPSTLHGRDVKFVVLFPASNDVAWNFDTKRRSSDKGSVFPPDSDGYRVDIPTNGRFTAANAFRLALQGGLHHPDHGGHELALYNALGATVPSNSHISATWRSTRMWVARDSLPEPMPSSSPDRRVRDSRATSSRRQTRYKRERTRSPSTSLSSSSSGSSSTSHSPSISPGKSSHRSGNRQRRSTRRRSPRGEREGRRSPSPRKRSRRSPQRERHQQRGQSQRNEHKRDRGYTRQQDFPDGRAPERSSGSK